MEQHSNLVEFQLRNAVLARQALHLGRVALDGMRGDQPIGGRTVVGTPLAPRAALMAALCPPPSNPVPVLDDADCAAVEADIDYLTARHRGPEPEAPVAAFEPRAVALQLVFLATLAQASPEFLRQQLDDQTLGICGLWNALRQAGQGQDLPSVFDDAAFDLTGLVVGAPPHPSGMVLDDLARSHSALLAQGAPALAATLPEDGLELVTRALRGASMAKGRGTTRGGRLIAGVTAGQELAIMESLPPVVRTALNSEMKYRSDVHAAWEVRHQHAANSAPAADPKEISGLRTGVFMVDPQFSGPTAF